MPLRAGVRHPRRLFCEREPALRPSGVRRTPGRR